MVQIYNNINYLDCLISMGQRIFIRKRLALEIKINKNYNKNIFNYKINISILYFFVSPSAKIGKYFYFFTSEE